MKYKSAWRWLKSNSSAPFSTIVYVSTIAVVIKVKNLFVEEEQKVMIEVFDENQQIPRTVHFLPRICIVREETFESAVTDVIDNFVRA